MPECSTVYEERCVERTTEVCDPVTRIRHHNRWGQIVVIIDIFYLKKSLHYSNELYSLLPPLGFISNYNKNFIKETSDQTKISGHL